MLALCTFPLFYLIAPLLIVMGATGWSIENPTTLTRLAFVVFGVVCLLVGAFLHREIRRCRDVPGYFRKHYSPFRDL